MSVTAALVAITTPAIIGLAIALEQHPGGAELREILHLFGPFLGAIIVLTICLIIYWWELATNKDLPARTRKLWMAIIFVFPWAVIAFWWKHVRGERTTLGTRDP